MLTGSGRVAPRAASRIRSARSRQVSCPTAGGSGRRASAGDVLAPPVQHGGDVVGGAELALGDGLDEELAGVPAEQLRACRGHARGWPRPGR